MGRRRTNRVEYDRTEDKPEEDGEVKSKEERTNLEQKRQSEGAMDKGAKK